MRVLDFIKRKPNKDFEGALAATKMEATLETINQVIEAQNFGNNADFVLKELNERMGPQLRPSLDAFSQVSSQEGIKVPRYPLPPHLFFELPKYSDILRTVFSAIKREIFRNGIEVEEKFKWKCTKCGEEYDDERDEDGECDICKTKSLREPDIKEKKVAERLVNEVLNFNGQKLIDVCYQLEDDINTIDNLYIILIKNYETNSAGEIIDAKPKELLRVHPLFIQKICDKQGIPGRTNDGKIVTVCPFHREIALYNQTKCPKCKSKTYLTTHVAHAGGYAAVGALEPRNRIHYLENEVFHASRYQPSLTYGWPPLIPVWQKAITLLNMDRYIKEYYVKQRPPKDLLLVNTRNAESLKKSWMWLLDQIKKRPHIPHPLAVESESRRGQVAQHINLMDTLTDMQYVESRNEFRRTIGATYGVMPLFAADLSQSGGLNNEGLQVTVTNRTVEASQETYNEKFFPWLCEQYDVHDWKIVAQPSEEKDEMHEMQLEAQKISNAQQMKNLGFNVERDADGNFSFEKDPNADMNRPFGQGFGQPGIGGQKPPQVPGAAGLGRAGGGLSGGARYTGEPPGLRRAYVSKDAEFFGDVEKAVDEVNLELIGFNESMVNKAAISSELKRKIEQSLFERRFEGLTWKESNRIKETLISAFRTGKSMRELIKEVSSVSKKISMGEAERIVRTENQAIRNTAREHSFRASDPEGEKKYKWLGPQDKRTTKICTAIKSRTSKGVSLEKLKLILTEESKKGGFEPRDWTPHINCRHVFVRAV